MRTRTRRRALTAAPLITAALALAGCSDPGGEPSRPPTPVVLPDATPSDDADPTSSPPDATPTTDQPAPPTATTAPPEDDTQTTTALPAADRPEMPEVANENSTEGAEAYAVHYLETVAWLATDPQEGVLEEFRLADDCRMCATFAESNAERVESDSRFRTRTFDLGTPDTVARQGGVSILIPVIQHELDEVDADDQVVGGQQGIEVRAGIELSWTDAGWRIDDVYRES